MQPLVSREYLLSAMAPVVQSARKRLGLTQERLAERVALTTEFVARIERGRSLPSLENFVHIVDTLGVSADDMLGTSHLRAPPVDPLANAPTDLARMAARIMRLDRLGRAAVNAVLRALEARAAASPDP